MKDNENKSTRVTFFINDEKVASILEQLGACLSNKLF